MQFTFLDMAGKVLFTRNDAERAQWTQEELTLELEFPRVEGKVISIGQRVFFIDPATNTHQIYEIKQAKTLEPDHFQQITAENICISELSDEHINESEIDNKTVSATLSGVLSGTLWSVGTVNVNPVSSANLSRGSVWQNVLQIKDNWNVYIEPRVTLASNGTITRKLDIISTDGAWNGLRLSIDKNVLDPSVTYDDSEVVTAMYGYGGTPIATKAGEEEKETTFSDVVWKKTADHPAKPKGQTYIEDPAATTAYGRNGRKRFGFYQNTDITDPEILLQKTWESLKVNSKPQISIEGTVADLYRMGYADQPVKLHDIALVEVLPAGYKDQIQIIRCTVDLLDASATTVTIGSYIPNIIYIERKTNENATGSRGGGGSNKSTQTVRSEYETAIVKNNREIQLRAYQNDLDDLDGEVKKQDARITVEANRITTEVTDRRNADNTLSGRITVESGRITQEVKQRTTETQYLSASLQIEANRITQEVTDRSKADGTLSSRITQTASEISAEVSRATTAEGNLSSRITINAEGISTKVSKNGVISAINQSAESVTIQASKITLDGNAVAASLLSQDLTCSDITCDGLTVYSDIECSDVVTCDSISAQGGYVGGSGLSVAGLSVDSGGSIEVDNGKIKIGSYNGSWKSQSVVTAVAVTTSGIKNFALSDGSTWSHVVVTAVESVKTTIYYLGH